MVAEWVTKIAECVSMPNSEDGCSLMVAENTMLVRFDRFFMSVEDPLF